MAATLRVAAELRNLSVIRHFVVEAAGALGVPAPIVEGLELAVDELAMNTIQHGYRGQPGEIEIEVRGEDETAVVICLRDEAGPFDPTQHAEPDVSLPLERRPVGGLGIFLARRYVDVMTYRRTSANRNEVTLTKYLDRRPHEDLSQGTHHEHDQ